MEAECEGCWKTIPRDAVRYHCTTCDWAERCVACYADNRTEPHPHAMFAEKGHPWVNQDAVSGPTAASILTSAFQHFPNRWCLGWRPVLDDKETLAPTYKWLTFSDVAQRVRHLAAGLCALGIQPRSHLAICSPNRLEWYLTDFACIYRSIISVGLHTNSNSADMLYILERTQAVSVVCSPEFIDLFIELKASLPLLRHIIVFGKHQPSSPEESVEYGIKHREDLTVLPLWHVEKKGEQYISQHPEFELEVVNKPEDVVTVIYTSGSTGRPKGTIYTEKMWHHTISGRAPLYPFPAVYMTSGPLSASSTRKNTERALCNGSRIGCFAGGVDRLLMEIPILRPTILSGPPITWITVHQLYRQAVQSALRQASANDYQTKSNIKAQVAKQFQSMLGDGCIRTITIGGAPVPKEVVQFVKTLLKIEIRESYGATEIGGIYSDGKVDSKVEVKLEDWEEYKTTDFPYPRGEILVRSPSVTPGYYLDEEQTKEHFSDGWFRTGDIGELREYDGRKYVQLIDRKRNLFKLAQGLFVVPEKIESALTVGCPSIKECYVYGDGTRSYLVAIIVPTKIESPSDTYAEDSSQEERMKQILSEIREVAHREKLKYYEVPRTIHLTPEPFNEKNQQRTITGKLNRRVLEQRYVKEIDMMYSHTASQVYQLRDVIRDEVTRTILSPEHEVIEGGSSLLEMGGDSLGAVNLMKTIRERFHVNVPLTMILERPLDELADYIQQNSGSASTQQAIYMDSLLSPKQDLESSTATIDWRKDSKLDPETARLLRGKVVAPRPACGIFLTGATGFLGAFLLHALLREYPDRLVWCLVRVVRQSDESVRNDELALTRIRSHMQDYELWDESFSLRIQPVVGELSKENFGMSSSRFTELASQISMIIHCGAWVNSLLSYSSLYKTNVIGTQNVLRLAVSGNGMATVHHISSLSVLQDRAKINNEDEDMKQIMLRVSEGNMDKYISDLKSGYRQTKCVAELLVRRARKRGLPVNVFRCGMIVGESGNELINTAGNRQGGVANESDWVSRLIGGIAHMRSYPSCKGVEFNFIPVDFAAATIVRIAKHHGDGKDELGGLPGRVYHINNFSHGTTLETLLDGVRRFLSSSSVSCPPLQSDTESAGDPLEALTFVAWRKQLFASDERNPLFVVRSLFYSWFPGTTFVNCTNTKQALQAIREKTQKDDNIDETIAVCPRIDEETVARWLEHLRRKW